ncbi:precorrin-3B C(17)-methyltransferase [Chlorobium phaeovibrioides]|uniref:Precorrin-3B C(17)-methyltransferase n=1 Tax=Chlorobium phaeovibrioides TaxID=1094 RepID=A0A5M8IDK7_CHLPH|nr:precorrin-3B C(17)-methyltransferase [Chlorobium phaeovibrioides]KAA6232419.1 precorrin-3B C(17)-methyltransferase [Chlorobium phaeovibrioides]MWV55015.1 precorrin-3B C(17)-methyltransferase [Chlorobium phaeovibrioides]QEQ57081.1 precorrin-3B C(17)-methyltransferase [Chlorobium phaeovibrioides]
MRGKISVVGLGPGDESMMTPQVLEALNRADAIVGYSGYMKSIEHLIPPSVLKFSTGMTREMDRAEQAFAMAAEGRHVVVVSSGDAGIYGMAPLIIELYERGGHGDPEIEVLPGISAFQAASARIGAPISHDFCAISLSDLMTPWELIEKRIVAAASADFVTAVYNPKSRDRYWQLYRLRELFLQHRDPSTPVAIVRNATRVDEEIVVSTLGGFDPDVVDMFTVLIVGNSRSRIAGDFLLTPRGYFDQDENEGSYNVGATIMSGSFRTIASLMRRNDLDDDAKWAVMHTIHTTADFEMEKLFYASPGAIRHWHKILKGGGGEIVTDVTMVQSGIRKAALERYGIKVYCYLNDPRTAELAASEGLTRSQAGMRLAVKEHPGALYVVGNAPTALIELASILHRTPFAPMGVIGAPVGFVNVVESKHRLKAACGDTPIAVIEGRKGGSGIAATIVNAAFSLDEAAAMNPGRDV